MIDKHEQTYRVTVVIASFVLIPFSPWWIAALIILVGVFAFDDFFEGIGLAFILDLLYGPPHHLSFVAFPFTLCIAIAVALVPFFKRRVMFWPS